MRNADRYWQDQYFFMLVNEKLLGALVNAFFPLWSPFRKELTKRPLKAFLFEAKLKQLIAQSNREWDEINIPHRFRQSSIWKDFIVIQSGEKPRKKVPMKMKEQVKSIVSESSNEPQITEEEEIHMECIFKGIGERGAEMMKTMVDRFDKAKAKNGALRESIKQKDKDITGLVTRIVGEYEKANLKDHYEFLKEYKQGLLIDADVVEEIKLYEESLAKVEANVHL
ncbi:hypothetical protein TIFTF001_052494 [Ficus carica]|uniref:Uncharacterized protein n=1 Tax=Ficus carica TaxID=3494 RepID=A0AA88JJQ1_FICCA|nr:hypothetical protein TIFTF001_052494 [Ficus carica]